MSGDSETEDEERQNQRIQVRDDAQRHARGARRTALLRGPAGPDIQNGEVRADTARNSARRPRPHTDMEGARHKRVPQAQKHGGVRKAAALRAP